MRVRYHRCNRRSRSGHLSLFKARTITRATRLPFNRVPSFCGGLFRAFGVLAIVRSCVPILRRARHLSSRPIQVIITTCKIRRPSFDSGTTLNGTFLPSSKRFHVNRSVVQVNVRVTFRTIGPSALICISQGCPIMVPLFHRVRVIHMYQTITRRRHPLGVTFGYTLIQERKRRRFVRAPCVLPHLRKTILFRILQRDRRRQFPLVRRMSFLALHFHGTMNLPRKRSRRRNACTRVSCPRRARLSRTTLSIFW